MGMFSKVATPNINAGFSLSNAAQFMGMMAKSRIEIESATRDAGKEIASETLKEIRSRLYPGHGYRTGALKNSYRADATTSGATCHIEASSPLHYASAVEYRWGGRTSHLRPAIEVMKNRAPEIIRKHYNPMIKSILLGK